MSDRFNSKTIDSHSNNTLSPFRVNLITIFLSFSLFTALTGEDIDIPEFPLY